MTSPRKDKLEFQKEEKKIFFSQGRTSTMPSMWEGAQQERGTEIMPIWQEYKEQGKKNTAQAMTEQKGRANLCKTL